MKFVQYKMRVPGRVLSIIVTLVFVTAIIAGIMWLIIPPMIEQFEKLGELATRYLQQKTQIDDFPATIQEWIKEHNHEIERFFHSSDFTDTLKTAMPQVFNVLGQTANVIISIVGSFITLLYMLPSSPCLDAIVLSFLTGRARELWAWVK